MGILIGMVANKNQSNEPYYIEFCGVIIACIISYPILMTIQMFI